MPKHLNKSCKRCDILFDDIHKNDQIYCSRKCSIEDRYEKYIIEWLRGVRSGGSDDVSNYVRRFLFYKNKNSCEKCGWSKIHNITGNVPLQINHKDGNYMNNCPDNLELICPNCHSLTENFGSLNKGRGRHKRRKMGA